VNKILLLSALLLAGCTGDEEPVQPSMDVGVGVGASGAHGFGAVGLHQGPLSIYIGF